MVSTGPDGGQSGDAPTLDESAASVLDGVTAVAVVDADGHVAWVNDAFEAFFGVDRDDVVGAHEHTVVREHLAPATDDPGRFTEAVLADGAHRFTCHVTPGDRRSDRWLERESQSIDRGEYAGGRVERYRDVTDRVERDREIRRQRDELDRLERVNSIVRDVHRGLVDATSRDEAETAIVERLAACDPFPFAVVGEFQRSVGEFAPRTWAGLGDPDALLADTPRDPVVDAARTHHTQVAPVDSDAACRVGVTAVAAIPVEYHNQVYGVLCVYAADPGAFDDRELAVLAELGESVAHAINAIERRDALLGEQVVEVGLRSRVAAEPFAALGDLTATVVVEHTIPLSDGRFVQYVAVDGLQPDEFQAAVDHVPRYEHARYVGGRDGTHLFEITATEPPIAGPVADHGGRVERVVVEGDELFVDAELSQSADVRSVLDALRHEIPDVSLVYHRAVPQRRTTTADVDAALEQLTDRQRTVFEAAYYAGYFDWPRKSTAQELADSLDISSPTFHQHLRRALKKLLSAFVEE